MTNEAAQNVAAARRIATAPKVSKIHPLMILQRMPLRLA